MKSQIATFAAAAFLVLAPAVSHAQDSSASRPAASGGMESPSGIGGSGAFSGWLSDYQTKNQGRVSRQAYMDEVGKRWDQADKNKQGLTTDQIGTIYGVEGRPVTPEVARTMKGK